MKYVASDVMSLNNEVISDFNTQEVQQVEIYILIKTTDFQDYHNVTYSELETNKKNGLFNIPA